MWEILFGEHESLDLSAQYEVTTKQNPLVLLEGLARRKRALKSDVDPSQEEGSLQSAVGCGIIKSRGVSQVFQSLKPSLSQSEPERLTVLSTKTETSWLRLSVPVVFVLPRTALKPTDVRDIDEGSMPCRSSTLKQQ